MASFRYDFFGNMTFLKEPKLKPTAEIYSSSNYSSLIFSHKLPIFPAITVDNSVDKLWISLWTNCG